MTIPQPSPRRRVTKTFCTTREAAEILGVSLRTVQMWSNNGLIETWKTHGGHRRLSRASVERLVLRRPKETLIAAAPALLPPAHTGAGEGRPLRILVAEDEPDLLRLYRLQISRWTPKPQLTTASDGYEALILIGRETPDLLVLDLNMPEFDGFRLLRSLRQMPELGRMQIVIVTGLADADIARGDGIPDDIPVLPKPIPFDQLRAIAEDVAAARQRDSKEDAAGGRS